MTKSAGAETECLRGKYLFAIGAVVAVLAILPVLVAPHLLLLDAPAHEARINVLRDLLLSGKGSPFYRLDTFFLPNIAFDVIGLGLSFFASPEEVGRIFFALTLILSVSGVTVLNRVVTARWSIMPLAYGLVLYNLVAILGFFSYAFGLALVPWALAARIKFERGFPLVGFLIGTGFAILLLFCHVFDFGIYAVMSTGFAFTALRQGRITWHGGFLRLLEMVPAGLLFLTMSTGIKSPARYDPHYLSSKLSGILKSLSSASMAGDAAFVAGALCLVAVLALCARTRLISSFIPGMISLAALYFVLPPNMASGSYVDVRMPIAVVLMLFAGLDVQLIHRKRTAILLVLVAIAFVSKQVAIAAQWRSQSIQSGQLIRELASLPAPAIIMQSECQSESDGIQSIYDRRSPSLQHIAAMSAFSDTRFVADLYAIHGQQPIAAAPSYMDYYALQHQFDETCDPSNLRRRVSRIEALMDSKLEAGHSVPPVFFLSIRPPSSVELPPRAKLISSGPKHALYEIESLLK
jgi:hypothetical protein